MPAYDPDPFKITKLMGRQAELTRGDATLKRETQKFKKYDPATPSQSKPNHQDGDWENQTTPTENAIDQTLPAIDISKASTVHDQTTQQNTVDDADILVTDQTNSGDGTGGMEGDQAVPEQGIDTTANITPTAAALTEPNNVTSRNDSTQTEAFRRSTRKHTAPDRLGQWVQK